MRKTPVPKNVMSLLLVAMSLSLAVPAGGSLVFIIISLVDSIACHMRTASLCQGLGERSMAGLFWGMGHL